MPSALFQTDNTVGRREDLSDIITNISPTETPFLSSIARKPISSILTEWQTITLAAAASAGANANVEGASTTPASGTTTTRMSNRTQIFLKALRVSGTQLSVSMAGRASEWNLQMRLKMQELARDIESAFILSSAAAAGDVTGESARMLEGWGMSAITNATAGFLSSNVETLLTTASDTGTRKNMSETNFNNLLNTIWTSGGHPDVIYCNGWLKRVISSFSANATRYSSVDVGTDRVLHSAVNVYESDFGQIQIKLNRYVAVTNIAAIQTEYWAMGELRPVEFSSLARDGDRESGQFIAEATLLAYAPTSSGKLIGAASASGATT